MIHSSMTDSVERLMREAGVQAGLAAWGGFTGGSVVLCVRQDEVEGAKEALLRGGYFSEPEGTIPGDVGLSFLDVWPMTAQ